MAAPRQKTLSGLEDQRIESIVEPREELPLLHEREHAARRSGQNARRPATIQPAEELLLILGTELVNAPQDERPRLAFRKREPRAVAPEHGPAERQPRGVEHPSDRERLAEHQRVGLRGGEDPPFARLDSQAGRRRCRPSEAFPCVQLVGRGFDGG